MALIDELKEMRKEAVSAREMQMAYVTAHQCNVDGWQSKIADLDTAIAALEPAPAEPETPKPESEVIGYFISEGRSVQMHADGTIAPLRADEPSQAPTSSPSTDEGRSDPGSEENAGTNLDEPGSQHGVDVEIPAGFTKWFGADCPGPEGYDEDAMVDVLYRDGVKTTAPVFSFVWSHNHMESAQNIIAYRIISEPAESEDAPSEFISDLTGDPAIEPESGLHADPEPTELDAPASIVDDPELLAAVARAEATLQEAEPAYVGLQDAELDAEYEAMREREKAGKPKLHFSIFGMKREDA